MSQQTYEEFEFILMQLQQAMKCLDKIEQGSPVEEHIAGAYKELYDAENVAKRLQKMAPYALED